MKNTGECSTGNVVVDRVSSNVVCYHSNGAVVAIECQANVRQKWL